MYIAKNYRSMVRRDKIYLVYNDKFKSKQTVILKYKMLEHEILYSKQNFLVET